MRIRAVASLAFVAALAALAAGCGAGDEDVRPAGTASPVARVTCAEDGTRVATPIVEARRDGVHLELRNETDGRAHVTIERGPSGGIGAGGPPGLSSHVLTIGPGTWTATCYESVDAVRGATFDVADTGIWVSTELTDCDTAEVSHGDPPRRVATDRSELAALARSSLESSVSVDPDAVIEPAGYPEQAEAIFRARKDGRTVATMSFWPDYTGGWLEGEARSCPDESGSSGAPWSTIGQNSAPCDGPLSEYGSKCSVRKYLPLLLSDPWAIIALANASSIWQQTSSSSGEPGTSLFLRVRAAQRRTGLCL